MSQSKTLLFLSMSMELSNPRSLIEIDDIPDTKEEESQTSIKNRLARKQICSRIKLTH